MSKLDMSQNTFLYKCTNTLLFYRHKTALNSKPAVENEMSKPRKKMSKKHPKNECLHFFQRDFSLLLLFSIEYLIFSFRCYSATKYPSRQRNYLLSSWSKNASVFGDRLTPSRCRPRTVDLCCSNLVLSDFTSRWNDCEQTHHQVGWRWLKMQDQKMENQKKQWTTIKHLKYLKTHSIISTPIFSYLYSVKTRTKPNNVVITQKG